MNSSKPIKYKQQKHKIFTKTQLKIWKKFVPNMPKIFSTIVAFKDNINWINIIFLISHLFCTLNFSIFTSEEKMESIWKI